MTTTIIEGLTVTDEMFAAAAAGVAAHAPSGVQLTRARFTEAAAWWLIPDADGLLYKAETTLWRTPSGMGRLNVWFRPDLRGPDALPMPHNHPWPQFTGHLLHGGYTEDRYWLDASGAVVKELGVVHRAGASNHVPREVFHEVTEVHAPGETLSLMVTGPRLNEGWGYLDVVTADYTQAQPVADFDAQLAALNPHQVRAA